ncbi:acetylxylan esterase [Brachybacterium fresconis]|uniref:Cephalosporin-C deacetylase n=1 Tax=Brachybacterium fresconis TaxID=173363 RepID=A0ABS4YM01_9MICO|nr:acetylxylan esterase [Brachybacterium fresconis]MBP2409824.1 cephalosporin-C deacetylase [Brachybacterium fresconis]
MEPPTDRAPDAAPPPERPAPAGPGGFDEFWQETLAEHAGGGDARIETVATPLRDIVVQDVTFPGFDGHPVKGWMLAPAYGGSRGTVVQFLGNNTGRGLPEQWTMLPSAGYRTFVMDNRGQSGPASVGDTPDPVGSGPQIVGRMTAGIHRPETYYYRRLFVDAVCAIGAVRNQETPGAGPLFVAGGSQGGATALAAAALCTGIAGALIDVPLLCDIPRAVETATEGPFLQIRDYLRTRRGDEEAVFASLSFFDGVHFASRAQAPALFAVGLQDPVCPPQGVLAAYEAYAGAGKTLCTYPFDGHEHGQWQHRRRQLEFLEHHTAGR